MGASDEGGEDGAFKRVEAAGDEGVGLEDGAVCTADVGQEDDAVCTADVKAGVGEDGQATSLLMDASVDGGFDHFLTDGCFR